MPRKWWEVDTEPSRWEKLRVWLLIILGGTAVAYNEADNLRFEHERQQQCNNEGC